MITDTNRFEMAATILLIGTLDTKPEKSPACHFFTADKAAWFESSKGAPEFEAWPEKDFLVLHGSKQGD